MQMTTTEKIKLIRDRAGLGYDVEITFINRETGERI